MKFDIVNRNRFRKIGEKVWDFLTPEFLNDKVVRILLFWGALLLGITWLIAAISFAPSSFQVPLKYNSFIGVTELGSWYGLYKIPAFLLVCFLMNGILASKLFSKDRMISYIILGTIIFLGLVSIIIVLNLRNLLLGS